LGFGILLTGALTLIGPLRLIGDPRRAKKT
jgi:hypothetical protein